VTPPLLQAISVATAGGQTVSFERQDRWVAVRVRDGDQWFQTRVDMSSGESAVANAVQVVSHHLSDEAASRTLSQPTGGWP
jgi:hypothetical protein